jgi:hypothetical protein
MLNLLSISRQTVQVDYRGSVNTNASGRHNLHDGASVRVGTHPADMNRCKPAASAGVPERVHLDWKTLGETSAFPLHRMTTGGTKMLKKLTTAAAIVLLVSSFALAGQTPTAPTAPSTVAPTTQPAQTNKPSSTAKKHHKHHKKHHKQQAQPSRG